MGVPEKDHTLGPSRPPAAISRGQKVAAGSCTVLVPLQGLSFSLPPQEVPQNTGLPSLMTSLLRIGMLFCRNEVPTSLSLPGFVCVSIHPSAHPCNILTAVFESPAYLCALRCVVIFCMGSSPS